MNPANETKQVQELFDHLTIAWNSGDKDQYDSFFTDDFEEITMLVQDGTVSGQQAANGKSIVMNQVGNIRFLSPDIALVSCTTTRFSWRNDSPTKDEFVNKSVVKKEQGAWKVAAIL